MARVTRRVASVAAVILAAVALGACGGGGTSTKAKNAYAERVNAAQTKFAATVTTVAQDTGQKNTISRQQRTLRRFHTAIQSVVSDLESIDPPSEVTKEHERLTAVMRRFGDDIGQANDAIRNPTPSAIDLAKRRLAAATETVNARVNAAIAAINVKLRGKK
ncbi:MAG: hypothetical protein QOE11_18 [Solirubrobacteraceae bacterium]|jgi:ElaB/YqjD/DUF883 family membrane-anchored ribosome-binding protein|nr:hypothetical protein [Solirubrobacteraceae bacterium]